MSYFTSPALAQGDSWTVNLDETWTSLTWNFQWANPEVNRSASLHGSADEGQTWFVFALLTASNGSSPPLFLTDKPLNAIRVVVDSAVAGETLTSQVTGK